MNYRALFSVGLVIVTLLAGMAHADGRRLSFLHVNDVYELQPRNGLGGVAYLSTILKEYREKDPEAMFTFGGDLLSPSLLSALVQGQQMIEAMNGLGLDLAVPGNHEFDFGPDNMIKQIGQSKAVWLAANMVSQKGELVPGIKKHSIREVHGVKVGFFGLITRDTITSSKPGDDWVFLPYLETAKSEVNYLKSQGAEVIVALTHLSLAEDRKLAEDVAGIDLILGGHDHDPATLYEHGTLIVKVGSDNQYLGVVEMRAEEGANRPLRWKLHWQVRAVVDVEPDPEMQVLVDRWQKRLDGTLSTPLFTVSVSFNSIDGDVRTRENALANLMADAMRHAVAADVALLNGGSLRGNRTYDVGYSFTAKDILTELPFNNVTVLLELKGSDLLAALENGVSHVEDLSGRFPQVSGMRVSFARDKPAGHRILGVTVGNAPLDPARIYKVATTDYLFSGKDDYQVLSKGNVLLDPSAATLVANHVKDWVLAHPDWKPRLEGRIVTVEKP